MTLCLQFLESRGYKTQKRGLIDVKGKGTMETYFVLGKGGLRSEGTYRDRSACRSLAAVVYGVVQARRKHMRKWLAQGIPVFVVDFYTLWIFAFERELAVVYGGKGVRMMYIVGISIALFLEADVIVWRFFLGRSSVDIWNEWMLLFFLSFLAFTAYSV